jgi:tetraprenyl-beta-curcumene synthase
VSAAPRERARLQSAGVQSGGQRSGARGATPPSGSAQIRALLVANGRFWTSVAPLARRELARWEGNAREIEDDTLRGLALRKLSHEAFNAEVAATLATLAPRRHRTDVVKAIVALEVLFDYLDGRTEALFTQAARPPAELLAEGRLLSETLDAVITGQAPSLSGADSGYLNALWRHAHAHYCGLPGHAVLAPTAKLAASRCAEAQLWLHAATTIGDEQLGAWAETECLGSGLGWREYVGGCASSVLAMHALIAAAARGEVTEAEARALNASYLAIGAVITTLDSLVDDTHDRQAGKAGYIRLYDGRSEIERVLLALIDDALARTSRLHNGAHHAMTLAGVAAYYTTHPGASDRENRAIRAGVRTRLAPTIWPALCVLVSWRGAKRVGGMLADRARQPARAARSRTDMSASEGR